MIKRTRLKFFAVIASIIIIMLSAFCMIILLNTFFRDKAKADVVLERSINDFGNQRPPIGNPFEYMRSFSVRLTTSGEIIDIKPSAFYTEEEIKNYVSQILAAEKNKGKIENIRFLIKDVSGGKVLAATDVSMESEAFKELLLTVLLSAGSCAVVLLTLTWFLSNRIVRPISQSFEIQKRFISDAGHELKTPITIISAGIKLLREQPQKISADSEKWLDAIDTQAERLGTMTAELLTLAKLDEQAGQKITAEFDLSQAVLNQILSFESLAYEQGKRIDCDIENGIAYKGDINAVKKAVGILCDNAVKHSAKDAEIKVGLNKQASKIVFQISNTGSAIKKEEIPLLFERFYRSSDSRAEVRGNGLGLAILKTLADNNGFKLNADASDGTITFTIIF